MTRGHGLEDNVRRVGARGLEIVTTGQKQAVDPARGPGGIVGHGQEDRAAAGLLHRLAVALVEVEIFPARAPALAVVETG